MANTYFDTPLNLSETLLVSLCRGSYGGFDPDLFAEKYEDHICAICLGILRNPVCTKCKHFFCESCFGCIRDNEDCARCPIDRNKLLPHEYYIARTTQKEIESKLILKCPWSSESCKWSGNLKQLVTHIEDDCEYAFIKCRECPKEIRRKFMDKHEIEHWRSRCRNLLSSIKNRTSPVWFIQKDTWTILNQSRKVLDNFVTPFYWAIPGVESLIGRRCILFSPPILTDYYGYRYQVRINMGGYGDGYGRFISAYLYLMNGPNDKSLRWPFAANFQLTLLDQRLKEEDRGQHFAKTLQFLSHPALFNSPLAGESRNTGLGWGRFASFQLLQDNYCVEDTIVVCVELTTKFQPS
ncbi:TNF receptor-associated factor 4 [Oopsacas minuta]|uniref:TNF receptor-associated factor 4 n=1 Tax=Oopsacas minuta TaxID=111878 RepID=A0AAV7JGK4_9METZ|nr:TNF receptor-associated factor 4 [Oopsacas minuta]